MSQRAKDLAERFTDFNSDIIALVENCADNNWATICSGEHWPMGVVARHIATGHYSAIKLAKMIVEGQSLPECIQEMIDQGNAQHSQKHTDCTKDEMLGILRENGSSVAQNIIGLDEADLDRSALQALAGGTISAQQFIENIIIHSGSEHFASMRAAVG